MIPWFAFLSAALLVSLIPGANQLLGLRHAAHHGAGVALLGIAARLAAFALMVGLVAAGVGAALLASPVLFDVVRWVGVAYLGWLGLSTLYRALRRRPDTAAPPVADPPRAVARRAAVREFVVALSNPKALLLFAALLPQFVPAGGDPGRDLLVLGAAYLGVEAVVGSLYVASGVLLRVGADSFERRGRLIDVLAACSFVGLAGVLAVDDL